MLGIEPSAMCTTHGQASPSHIPAFICFSFLLSLLFILVLDLTVAQAGLQLRETTCFCHPEYWVKDLCHNPQHQFLEPRERLKISNEAKAYLERNKTSVFGQFSHIVECEQKGPYSIRVKN